MSISKTSNNIWTVREQPYVLQYELLHSQNLCFEDFELWEYGISCKLFNEGNELVSEEKVQHISREQSYVISLIELMVKHKVFPVHLYDVVSDELMKKLDVIC